MFRRFRAAGGKVLLGTDSGFPHVMPGFSMHEELVEAVEQGMSNYEALCLATKLPAEFLEAKDCGTVEIGKQAQLLIIDSNPLENVYNTRKISAVIKREQYYSIDDLIKMRENASKKGLFRVESPVIKRMGKVLYNGFKKNIQLKLRGRR